MKRESWRKARSFGAGRPQLTMKRKLLRPYKVVFAGPEGTFQGVLYGRSEVHMERQARRYAEMRGWTLILISSDRKLDT